MARVELIQTNLSNANLSGVNFSGTDLTGVNLQGTLLTPAQLNQVPYPTTTQIVRNHVGA
jgi:uncharacterized protein YjbI with pentapeptide repeats